MKAPVYTLYYKEDNNLLYLPKDDEMTALEYVAIRYITQEEIPVLMANPNGVCFNESLNEENLNDLVAWYYKRYPEYRRESKRTHLFENIQQKINQLTVC